MDAVPQCAMWATLPGEHGVIVTARPRTGLVHHAAAALVLRRDVDAPPAVRLPPTSPELQALADARERYETAAPRRPRRLAGHAAACGIASTTVRRVLASNPPVQAPVATIAPGALGGSKLRG